MRPQRLQRMARIAGNDGGQGFLDLGALLLARAQRGGEFGLFAVRPRGDDLVIDADIAANHTEQAARCRRRANAIVAEYRIEIAGMSAVQQEEIGRAACRERGWQYVESSGVAGPLKKKKKTT